MSGLKDLLEVVDLEVMAESEKAGTHLEGWRERITDCRSSVAETAGPV